jgi:hypothetical protein
MLSMGYHVTIYTPCIKDEMCFRDIDNITIRYGLVRIVMAEDIIYSLFSDMTGVVFDHNLIGRLFGRMGRFGEHIQLKSIIDKEYVVASIEAFAFADAINLNSILCPDQLKKIGYRAFFNATKLVHVTIPDSVEVIEDCAFESCLELRRVVIGKSVKTMGKGVFSECHRAMLFTGDENQDSSWNSDYNPDQIPVARGFIEFKTENNVQYALLNNFSAIVVDHHLDDLTNLQIPNQIVRNNERYTVTEVSPFAFENAKLLTGINLPTTIQRIHPLAFAGSNIGTITIPSSVDYLGRGFCCDCIFLKSVTIEEGLTVIPWSSFANDLSLESVHIASSVEEIGRSAFWNCRRLCTIQFPSHLKKIGDNALNGTNLSFVEIGESVTEVGESCFELIGSLKTVAILNEEVQLGDFLFTDSAGLSIYIAGEENSMLHERVQMLAPECKYFYWGSTKVREIDGVLYLLNEYDSARVVGYQPERLLEHIAILNEVESCLVTHITANAFRNAKQLKSLVVSDSVVRIGAGFIEGCDQLLECIIPEHLNPLKSECLIGVNNLKLIIKDNPYTAIEEQEIYIQVKAFLDRKDYFDVQEVQRRFSLGYGFAQKMIKRYRNQQSTDIESSNT